MTKQISNPVKDGQLNNNIIIKCTDATRNRCFTKKKKKIVQNQKECTDTIPNFNVRDNFNIITQCINCSFQHIIESLCLKVCIHIYRNSRATCRKKNHRNKRSRHAELPRWMNKCAFVSMPIKQTTIAKNLTEKNQLKIKRKKKWDKRLPLKTTNLI